VRAVVACNPYDYSKGVGRANRVASIYIGSSRLPGLGSVVTRMENKPVLGIVLRGDLRDGHKLPGHYLAELRRVGRRRGYVAREVYRNVDSMIAAASAAYWRTTVSSPTATHTRGSRRRCSSRTPADRSCGPGSTRDAHSLPTELPGGHLATAEQPRRLAELIDAVR
jgi:hypothetical protein